MIIEDLTVEQWKLMTILRKETGMGLMNCKECLEAYNWDYWLALENFQDFAWDGKLK